MKQQLRWLCLTGAFLVVLAGVLIAWERGTFRQQKEGPPVIREIGSLQVTNQAGTPVKLADLRGRPWAIDLIFTRCPGPCAQLTGVMKTVQERLPATSSAGLLSLTSDPEYDTPAVLKDYARRFGADTDRWQFVTGSPAEVRRLATEELLMVLQDKPTEEQTSPVDLFLHSTLIVILDGQGRMRSFVEGLEPGAADKIVEILRQLERED